MTRRIEASCGCAIWTSAAEFARQQALAAWLGFDPFLVHYTAVVKRVREKGVFIRGRNPSKALVFARLFAACAAAHPAPAISTVGNSADGESTTTKQKRTP